MWYLSGDMGRPGAGNTGTVFIDILAYFVIIYLARQPEGRCKLPVPVDYITEITVLFFTGSRTVIFYVSE